MRRLASAGGEGDRGRARRCLGEVLDSDADLGEEAGAPRMRGVGRGFCFPEPYCIARKLRRDFRCLRVNNSYQPEIVKSM